jgi:hypothetical protein
MPTRRCPQAEVLARHIAKFNEVVRDLEAPVVAVPAAVPMRAA